MNWLIIKNCWQKSAVVSQWAQQLTGIIFCMVKTIKYDYSSLRHGIEPQWHVFRYEIIHSIIIPCFELNIKAHILRLKVYCTDRNAILWDIKLIHFSSKFRSVHTLETILKMGQEVLEIHVITYAKINTLYHINLSFIHLAFACAHANEMQTVQDCTALIDKAPWDGWCTEGTIESQECFVFCLLKTTSWRLSIWTKLNSKFNLTLKASAEIAVFTQNVS